MCPVIPPEPSLAHILCIHRVVSQGSGCQQQKKTKTKHFRLSEMLNMTAHTAYIPTFNHQFVVGLPVPHGRFSSSRTSSILSKDPPPDKKPKSDKPSLTCDEFDPTGNFCCFIIRLTPLFSLTLILRDILLPLFHLCVHLCI